MYMLQIGRIHRLDGVRNLCGDVRAECRRNTDNSVGYLTRSRRQILAVDLACIAHVQPTYHITTSPDLPYDQRNTLIDAS